MSIGLSQSELSQEVRKWVKSSNEATAIANAISRAIERNNEELEKDIMRLIKRHTH
jgi:hypothetical protein